MMESRIDASTPIDVVRMLTKHGTPATHAFSRAIDAIKDEAVCGYVGRNEVYRNERGNIKVLFSNQERRVDCPDCKADPHFDLWILKHTEL